ncbi:MAG: choice-of-anchor D domain-containing protein [Bacteroidota bacterium]
MMNVLLTLLLINGILFPLTAMTQSLQSNVPITNGSVYTMQQSGSKIYLGGTFTYVGLLTGSAAVIDTANSYGDVGYPNVNGAINAAISDGSGGWYIGGDFTNVGGTARSRLAHINSDKTLDANWNPGANNTINTLLMYNGIIYIGGFFTNVAGASRNYIAAVDAVNGSIDGWNPNADNVITAMIIEGATIYAGGLFTNMNGTPRNHLAAIDATTGSIDGAFDPDLNESVYAMQYNGGSIFIGGSFTTVAGTTRNRLASVNATTGALDAWNPNANGVVFSLAIKGSKIYCGGDFDSVASTKRNHLAAINISSGALDALWNPNANNSVYSLAASGGKLYVGGDFGAIGGGTRNYVAALNFANGALESWSSGANNSVYVVAASGSKIFLGGIFTSGGGGSRNRLAAFDASTGIVDDWNPNANNLVQILLISGSKVFIGGAFTSVNGTTRNRLASVDITSGAVDASFNPNTNNWVRTMALSGTKLYIGGNFTSIGTTSRNYLAAVSTTNGSVDASWNPNANNIVRTMLVSGNKIYFGGDFTTIGATTRNYLAAVNNSTGAVDGSWNPNANAKVYSIILNNSKIYAAGAFTTINATTRNYIAKIETSLGTPDASFNPNADTIAYAVYAKGNKIYAGGEFSTVGGATRNNAAALDSTNGTADPLWNPSPQTSVNAFLVANNITYIGGTFDTVSGTYFPRLAGFTSSGPSISLSSSTVSFENVLVTSSEIDSITITNTGTEALNISAISSDNIQFTFSPLNGNIPVASTMQLYITFTPTSNGVKTASISFTHNASSSPTSISTSGTGEYLGFSANPSSLSFGSVVVGFSKTDSITVTNTEASNLTITSAVSSSGEFSVTPANATIAAADSQKFYVTFTPSSSGAKSGNIIFTHNFIGSPSSIPVTGTGSAPGFSMSASSLSFGDVLLSVSKTDSISVTNTGGASFSISSVTSNDAQFTITPSSATVNALSSVTFYITFSPTTTGAKSANIIFTHTAAGSPDTLSVSGNGIGSPKYRTFSSSTSLSLKENTIKPKSGQPAKLPNIGNWRDTVIVRAGGKNGIVFGIAQGTATAKQYGWIRLKKNASSVGKFFLAVQTDSTYNAPFDSIRKFSITKAKIFVKEFKPTSLTYYNPFVQEFCVFKLNVLSSTYGVTPKGFDSLLYIEDGSAWDSMQLTTMVPTIDSVLTYYKTKTLPGGITAAKGIVALEELRDILKKINGAFYANIALANGDSIVPNQGLKFAGMIELDTIDFLIQIPLPKSNTASINESKPLPLYFSLKQNYPNPFNPSTAIGFSLLAVGSVSLKVYDVLGREIVTLLNSEVMEAGAHEIIFDANTLPSGVYYYRLSAGVFSETKKLLLMK